jgi:hypothetical protein
VKAVESHRKASMRRAALVTLFAALCALGFLGSSAVGGDAAVVGSSGTAPGLAAVAGAVPPISVPAVSTALSVATVPPGSSAPSGSTSTAISTSTTATAAASTSVSSPTSNSGSSGTTITTSTTASTSVSTSTEAVQAVSDEAAGTTTVASGSQVETSVSVSVSGGGTVTGTSISCGASGSRCFGTFQRGTRVTLYARASRGNRFAGWSGGCNGASPVCLVRLSRQANVIANFARSRRNAIAISISRARFDVRGRRSLGGGKLELKGKIARRASVTVELRRAGATKALLTTDRSLPAGPFSLFIELPPGSLADGRPLLPGGLVVSISGRSGKLVVPRQLLTITLNPPRTLSSALR